MTRTSSVFRTVNCDELCPSKLPDSLCPGLTRLGRAVDETKFSNIGKPNRKKPGAFFYIMKASYDDVTENLSLRLFSPATLFRAKLFFGHLIRRSHNTPTYCISLIAAHVRIIFKSKNTQPCELHREQ